MPVLKYGELRRRLILVSAWIFVAFLLIAGHRAFSGDFLSNPASASGNQINVGKYESLAAVPDMETPAGTPLTLKEITQLVLDHNENIQIKALEWLASQKRLKAAKGIFEPEFVNAVERDETLKKNTAEQMFYLSKPFTSEKDTLYNSGLEFLTPTGAKMKMGYSMRQMHNNFQVLGKEYESFAGLNVTQPLLRDAGIDVTMAGIRLAAGESSLAFQEYRRQLMLIVSRSEAAYWDLFFTQEQGRIRSDSVRVALKLLEDNRVRAQAGKASELEVLQAEAGVALRLARQKDAEQKKVEAMNRLTSLFSGAKAYTNMQMRAIDQPQLREVSLAFYDSMQAAFQANPDYISQRTQVAQENIRVLYAKNQRWPQLDLKGSYGLNGLGNSIGATSDDLSKRGYESWTVGVELRIPLAGGIKAKNEWQAARARKQEALLALKSVEVEIANAVDTAIRHVGNARDSVTNYVKVVNFNERLLATELARLEAGKTESRKVLEVEENLSEARSVALENLVGYEKALIEWDLVKGTTLKSRNLELTQAILESKTVNLLQGGQWADIPYDKLRREAKTEFENKIKTVPKPGSAK